MNSDISDDNDDIIDAYIGTTQRTKYQIIMVKCFKKSKM